MPKRDFTKLRIYRFARKAATDVLIVCRDQEVDLSSSSPLADLAAAGRDICARIASAHLRLDAPEISADYLEEAMARAAEALVYLDFAHEIGLVADDRTRALARTYAELVRRLDRLAQRRRYRDEFGGNGSLDDE